MRSPTTSGRVNHAAKITVYLSEAELAALEAAKVEIRHNFGLRADRGHIVRAAIGIALKDYESGRSRSWLVERLREIR